MAQRRKDEAALRAEWSADPASSVDDDDLAMLRERIGLVETKETQLSEIKTMLRAMEPGLGLRFVNEADEVTGAAWAFVGLNVLLALYFANAFLLTPLQNSAALVAGSGT